MMVPLVFVASMLGQTQDANTAELVRLLVSSDRMERHQAAESLVKLPSVPESALPNIIQYLKLEVSGAMLPDTRPVRGKGKPIEKLPMVGDELSIPRLKAGGDQYLEKPFALTGAIKISDSYDFGFEKAQGSHYSFRFYVAAKNGQIDDTVSIYMSRFVGAALAEQITRVQERVPNSTMAVRLQCVVHRDRLAGDLSRIADVIEATDWQGFSAAKASWMPWTFEAIGLGYALMFKTGKASTVACLDLIMGDQEFQGPQPDTMLKGTAIQYLLELPAKDRALAFRRVSLRAKKVKGTIAREWTRRLYASLESGRLVL